MQDERTNAQDLIQLGQRPNETARPSRSRWAANDIIPALTRRVAELESQLASMQEHLEAERRRLVTYSESDRSLDDAVADGYRSADAILRRAGAEADDALTIAVSERRMLVSEVQRMREEREELRNEIASLGRGGLVGVPEAERVETPPALDLETAIAKEMRALLVEILADFRSRVAAPPPPAEPTAATIEAKVDVIAEAPEPIVESIVEHVDELPRPLSVNRSLTSTSRNFASPSHSRGLKESDGNPDTR